MSEVKTEKAVPEIEYFFDVPYKVYCGKCGRLIITGGANVPRKARPQMEACRWCGTPIDWEGVEDEWTRSRS